MQWQRREEGTKLWRLTGGHRFISSRARTGGVSKWRHTQLTTRIFFLVLWPGGTVCGMHTISDTMTMGNVSRPRRRAIFLLELDGAIWSIACGLLPRRSRTHRLLPISPLEARPEASKQLAAAGPQPDGHGGSRDRDCDCSAEALASRCSHSAVPVEHVHGKPP